MNKLQQITCLSVAGVKRGTMLLSFNTTFTKTYVLCWIVLEIFNQFIVCKTYEVLLITDMAVSSMPQHFIALLSNIQILHLPAVLEVIQIANSDGSSNYLFLYIQDLTPSSVESCFFPSLRCLRHT